MQAVFGVRKVELEFEGRVSPETSETPAVSIWAALGMNQHSLCSQLIAYLPSTVPRLYY